MLRRIVLAALLLLGLSAALLNASTITLTGIETTAWAILDFQYAPATGTVTITVTDFGGDPDIRLTSLAFNVPDAVTGWAPGGTLLPTNWWVNFDRDNINTPKQLGLFDVGVLSGANFGGGHPPYGEPAPVTSGTQFQIQFAGTGLGTLTEDSFLSLLSAPGGGNPDPQWFAARTQTPGDVLIPGEMPAPNPVPEPGTVFLALGMGLIWIGRRYTARKG